MGALTSMVAMVLILIGIGYIEDRIQSNRYQAFLLRRLINATQYEMDTELASAWLNRLALRSRLQNVGSR